MESSQSVFTLPSHRTKPRRGREHPNEIRAAIVTMQMICGFNYEDIEKNLEKHGYNIDRNVCQTIVAAALRNAGSEQPLEALACVSNGERRGKGPVADEHASKSTLRKRRREGRLKKGALLQPQANRSMDSKSSA